MEKAIKGYGSGHACIQSSNVSERPYLSLCSSQNDGNVDAGTIILEEEAYAKIATNRHTCDGCLGVVQRSHRPQPQPQHIHFDFYRRPVRCQGCGTVIVCQRSCLNHHSKLECVAFSSIRDMQKKKGALNRTLWLRFLVRAILNSVRSGPIETWRDFLDLASPDAAWEPDPQSMSDAEVFLPLSILHF